MKTRTAIVRSMPDKAVGPSKWEIVEVDLDEPRQGELLIKMTASGLCHSDDHLATGDIPVGDLPDGRWPRRRRRRRAGRPERRPGSGSR